MIQTKLTMRQEFLQPAVGEAALHGRDLTPMPLAISLVLFGVPAALGIAGLYVLLPALRQAGVSLLWSYTIALAGMFPLLLGAAVVAYRLEGRTVSLAELCRRFRIRQITGREWVWTAGLLIVFVGGQLLLMPTARWLANTLPLPMPEGLPYVLDPRVPKAALPSAFLDVPLRGNWSMALWYLCIVVLNVIGEEFWWRGYVLPRQELAYGRRTWIVHGILWTLFHAPMWWNLVALLPSTLSQAFVATRLKNTTPGIVVHAVNNGLGLAMVVIAIAGLGG